jgi:ribonucleoside-diphosphate reductase alpha chain
MERITKVRKRTGQIVQFDEEKIKNAIHKACSFLGFVEEKFAEETTRAVVDKLNQNINAFKDGIPDVEQIQDVIEEILFEKNERIAKAYSLYRRSRHLARQIREFLKLQDDLKFNATALKVLEERYLLKDEKGNIIETPRQMFERVAKTIANVEAKYGKSRKEIKEIEKKFFDMLINLEFLPNSPTLMNAGVELGQLSACFVLPIDDSLDSIFTTLNNMAKIQQSGGGTGFSFSKLRPKGDIVKSTKGVASGPVSFMKIYDMATEVIKQGGKRRGANMGVLAVWHPDIEEFIKAKADQKTLSNFNISVAADDAFMKAVMNDKEYWLINPRNKRKVKKIKARELFDKICYYTWLTGDPGMLFIDEINRRHTLKSEIGKIEATNPCIAKGTLVATDEGLKKIEDVHNPNKVFGVNGINPVLWAGKTGVKEVFRVETEAGYEVEATKDHKFLTAEGWKPLSELTENDVLVLQRDGMFGKTKLDKELAIACGWLLGDGCIHKDKVIFYFNKQEKRQILPLIKNYLERLNGREVKIKEYATEFQLRFSKRILKIFEELGFKQLKSNQKVVPEKILTLDKESMKYFLSALFTCDGSIQGSKEKGVSIRLASNSLTLLKQVQLMLLQFGIFSKLYENRREEHQKILPDARRKPKKYHCKPQHELVISRTSMFRFMKEIGFLTKEKNEKFRRLKPKKIYRDNITQFAKIKKIERIGFREVYDIKTMAHSFSANGIIVHNCGEVPLLPYEACNLGSINLSKMVKLKNGSFEFDWEKFEKTIRLAVRFLDNVIDASKFPLAEIDKVVKANRKIGLGVMGLADLFFMLKISYNSDEALKLAEKLARFLRKVAYDESHKLALEKGTFPNFKASKHKKPMRNATVLSIAPTGTLSIIANCSSSIEPLFALVFEREILEGKRFLEVNKWFLRELLKRGLYSDELIEKVAISGNLKDVDLPKDIKEVFVTALEIPYQQHIKMQAIWQKYVDNSVSKTINMPQDASIEDVKNAFLLAYKLKCKGVTIYRYGSKPKQVLYVGKGKEKTIAKLHFSECLGGVCYL